MAEHERAQDWIAAWNELSRQFLSAWQGAQTGAGPRVPLHDAFELWARLAGGDDAGNATVDRMIAAARQFVALMQAAIAQAGGQRAQDGLPDWAAALGSALGPFDPIDNPVAHALRGLIGKGVQGFEQLHAELRHSIAPMRQEWLGLLRLPAFGYTREAQLRQQQLAAAWTAYSEQLDRYHGLLLTASRKALERLESTLAEHSEPGRQFKSLRELYDAWIDAAEAGYAEVASSPEFRSVYGALVNAQMQVRRRVQQEIERATGSIGMPTRTEVDAVHRKLAALQRRIAALEQQLAAQAAPQAAPPAEPAGPPAAVAGRPARRRAATPPRPRAVAASAQRPRPRTGAKATASTTRATPLLAPTRSRAGRGPAGGLAAQLAELRQAVRPRKGAK